MEFKDGKHMKGCQTNENPGDNEPFVTNRIKSLQGIKGTLNAEELDGMLDVA